MEQYACLFVLLATTFATSFAVQSGGVPHDLHEYVSQNELGAVELAMRDNQNPNDPNEFGHLAIVSAVRTKNMEIAEFLLTFLANATLSEPISGSSAVVTAFEHGDAEMARLLLKYGSGPDVHDANGDTARSVAGSESELTKLLEEYDTDGSMAFEDPPGFWAKAIAKEHGGVPYYYNQEANKTQYNVPTSCSWIRIIVDGLPIYVNTRTHQSVWRRPDALSWRKLVDATTGAEYYYNYRTHITIAHVPAEVPNDLLTEIQRETGTYWYNHVTGEHSWEDPREISWQKAKHATGHEYFFHPDTQESTWDVPEEHEWVEHMSHEHGRPFYTSLRGGDSQWEKPAALGWIKGNLLTSGVAMSDEF